MSFIVRITYYLINGVILFPKVILIVHKMFPLNKALEETSASNRNSHRELLWKKGVLKIWVKSLKIPAKEIKQFLHWYLSMI